MMKYTMYPLAIAFLLLACDARPKVIEATATNATTPAAEADPALNTLHKVVVDELLHTSRYTYLYVTEDDQQFWIAIPRKDVEVGATYYYRGGLKKTNFKSVEHDRVFETMYLVSDVSKDPGMATGQPHAHTGQPLASDAGTEITPPPGGISLAELLDNKSKYDGQIVRVRGRSIKINNMIMGRNWIHLKDDSLDDPDADLTITTTESVPLNAVVAFEGRITLNKDFGAGYKYEIIMEEARLLQ